MTKQEAKEYVDKRYKELTEYQKIGKLQAINMCIKELAEQRFAVVLDMDTMRYPIKGVSVDNGLPVYHV